MNLLCSRYVDFTQALQVSLIELISQAFETESYPETFPQLFHAGSLTRFLVFEEEDQCIAAVAISPLDFVVSGRMLRVACMGTVCVTKAKQGLGFAKKLLLAAISYCRKNQFDVIVLFSGDPRIYAAMGFRYFGSETLVCKLPMGRETAEPGSQTQSNKTLRAFISDSHELSPAVVSIVWRLYQKSAGAVAPYSSYQEFLQIVCHTKMKVMLVVEDQTEDPLPVLDLRENRLLAVFFLGKGADFEATWHSLVVNEEVERKDCAGRDETLKFVVDSAFAHFPQSIIHFGVGDTMLLQRVVALVKISEADSHSMRTFANMMKLELTTVSETLFLNETCFQLPSLLST